MQLMGPGSQERELPADNCHCCPVKHGIEREKLAIAPPRRGPHKGIIKPPFHQTRTERCSKQSGGKWFPTRLWRSALLESRSGRLARRLPAVPSCDGWNTAPAWRVEVDRTAFQCMNTAKVKRGSRGVVFRSGATSYHGDKLWFDNIMAGGTHAPTVRDMRSVLNYIWSERLIDSFCGMKVCLFFNHN